MSDESSEGPSVYEMLSSSERIIDGSVSFDWRKIPVDLVPTLPLADRPKANTAMNSIMYKKKEKDLEVKTKKPRNQSRAQNTLQTISLNNSENADSDAGDEAQKLPLTFNNCHFHYDNPGEKKVVPDTSKVTQSMNSSSNPNDFKNSVKEFLAEKLNKIPPLLENEYIIRKSDKAQRMSISEFHKSVDNMSSFQSSYPLLKEGVEREKQVFETVHQELCALSRDLKMRNEKIQEAAFKVETEKLALANDRTALEKRERNMRKEVQLAMKAREEQLKDDTRRIVTKYEGVLEQLGKENRRVQISLKDMVATNRILRDQSKKTQEDLEDRDSKIEELQNQLKLTKDKLKAIVPRPADVKGQNTLIDAGASTEGELFLQMKKIISLQTAKKPSMIDATIQTVDYDRSALDQAAEEGRGLFLMLRYILCDGKDFYEAVSRSYEFIFSREGINHVNHSNQLLYEKYLELIVKSVEPLDMFEKHAIGGLVYKTLGHFRTTNTLSHLSSKLVVLLHLIPLYTIMQSDVSEALLDGLLLQLSRSIQSRVFLVELGIEPFFVFLSRAPVAEKISGLASSVFLTLASEDSFFANGSHLLENFQQALEIPQPLTTVENLIVLIQRLSRTEKLPPKFLEVLKKIHSKHLSDFCDLNLKSILQQ